MTQLILERYYTPFGTFGTLELPNTGKVFTIECPWLHNEKFISCIPEGVYVCERFNSPTYGNTFRVKDVPNRWGILFHVGNSPAELQGCIALAKGNPMFHKGTWGISRSRDAMNQFFDSLQNVNSFLLTIKQWRP